MMPKAKISVMMSERYSLTLGRNEMPGVDSVASCCMPTEKRIRSGIAMK